LHSANIHEAKTHFSQLIAWVQQGEEVIIQRAGKPVAKLIPYAAPTSVRPAGQLRGKIHMTEDFDSLPDELLAAFQGESA
jgi:prevent-host-death family protein